MLSQPKSKGVNFSDMNFQSALEPGLFRRAEIATNAPENLVEVKLQAPTARMWCTYKPRGTKVFIVSSKAFSEPFLRKRMTTPVTEMQGGVHWF
jgi:hypothetical protein